MVTNKRDNKSFSEEYVKDFNCSWKSASSKFIDLTGESFGELYVIKLHRSERPHTYWFVRCSCGGINSYSTNTLNRGRSSCKKCHSLEKDTIRVRHGIDKYLNEIVHIYPRLELVHGKDGKTGTAWDWYCNKCDTNFPASPNNLKSVKRHSCRCGDSNFRHWTQELREDQVEVICSERNMTFLGWYSDGGYTNNTSRVKLSCNRDDHKDWDMSICNITSPNKYGCPACGIIKRALTHKHSETDITTKGKTLHKGKYTYDNYIYLDSRTSGEIHCTSCDEPFVQSYDNHINQRKGCPLCKGRRQQECYIFQVKDDNAIISIKAGIANHYAPRLLSQNLKSVYDVTLIGVWDMPDVKSCKGAESKIKSTLKGNYLSKEEYSDGYTETHHSRELDNIIKTFTSYGGIRRLDD